MDALMVMNAGAAIDIANGATGGPSALAERRQKTLEVLQNEVLALKSDVVQLTELLRATLQDEIVRQTAEENATLRARNARLLHEQGDLLIEQQNLLHDLDLLQQEHQKCLQKQHHISSNSSSSSARLTTSSTGTTRVG
eukprot:GEZU01029339.1.p1 GENE.GEZU01029339.1~~GEZU01029339.1.p1  ORF type:complete len:148 (+),score=53.48 GEZU01029339.1:28-444(+)